MAGLPMDVEAIATVIPSPTPAISEAPRPATEFEVEVIEGHAAVNPNNPITLHELREVYKDDRPDPACSSSRPLLVDHASAWDAHAGICPIDACVARARACVRACVCACGACGACVRA